MDEGRGPGGWGRRAVQQEPARGLWRPQTPYGAWLLDTEITTIFFGGGYSYGMVRYNSNLDTVTSRSRYTRHWGETEAYYSQPGFIGNQQQHLRIIAALTVGRLWCRQSRVAQQG